MEFFLNIPKIFQPILWTPHVISAEPALLLKPAEAVTTLRGDIWDVARYFAIKLNIFSWNISLLCEMSPLSFTYKIKMKISIWYYMSKTDLFSSNPAVNNRCCYINTVHGFSKNSKVTQNRLQSHGSSESSGRGHGGGPRGRGGGRLRPPRRPRRAGTVFQLMLLKSVDFLDCFALKKYENVWYLAHLRPFHYAVITSI